MKINKKSNICNISIIYFNFFKIKDIRIFRNLNRIKKKIFISFYELILQNFEKNLPIKFFLVILTL